MVVQKDRLAGAQRGATAIEYALIVGILAVVLIAAFTALGGGLEGAFNEVIEIISGSGDGEG